MSAKGELPPDQGRDMNNYVNNDIDEGLGLGLPPI